MANIERGEVEVIVNDKPYTLKLSMNASVALQQRTKKTMRELLESATSLDFEAIRDIVHLLLQKCHADEFKTLSKVGEFIDDAGGVAVFFDVLERLTKANQDPNPPLAQATDTGAPIGELSPETPVVTVA